MQKVVAAAAECKGCCDMSLLLTALDYRASRMSIRSMSFVTVSCDLMSNVLMTNVEGVSMQW